MAGAAGFKAILAAALTALSTPSFAASDYASCLLDKLPGIQSGAAFSSALTLCGKEFPDRYFTIERGSGRGILGYKSPEACTLAKAKSTTWQPAAANIRIACGCLYGNSSGKFDMCERYNLPSSVLSQHDVSTPAKAYSIETHYRRIYTAHPDADEVVFSQKFMQWIAQDSARETSLTKGTTQQFIQLLTTFKSTEFSTSQTSPKTNEVDWEKGVMSYPKDR